MKYSIAVIASTALMAVGSNLNSAQPPAAGADVFATPAAAPEPPEPPEPPRLAAADDSAAEVYQLVTEWSGQAGSAGRAGRTLVIPREAGDPKEFAEMEEDLNVMARILEKAASGRDERHPHAMGITLQSGILGSSGVPKNLYIEGHGVLFFLNVNFPLLAPATRSPETDAKEETSTEWEEARRELYQRPGTGFEFNWAPAAARGPAEEFDANRVEDLKRDVAAALKNASHIRKLKSDESVTVVISGRSAGGETTVAKRSTGGGGAASAGGETRTLKKSSGGASSRVAPRASVVVARSGGGEGGGTRLILRARRADIESFQKDRISLDDFRKKVTTIVY